MGGGVHAPEHSHPLTDGWVEVVVVGNGGDPKTGVVLGGGVGAIAVARVLRDTVLSLVCQFGRFFVLTLYTAHYFTSAQERETHIHSHTLYMMSAQKDDNSTTSRLFCCTSTPS